VTCVWWIEMIVRETQSIHAIIFQAAYLLIFFLTGALDDLVGLTAWQKLFLHGRPVGNIGLQPLAEIWNSDEMQRMRQLHVAKRANEIDICSRCCTTIPHPLLVAGSLILHGRTVRKFLPWPRLSRRADLSSRADSSLEIRKLHVVDLTIWVYRRCNTGPTGQILFRLCPSSECGTRRSLPGHYPGGLYRAACLWTNTGRFAPGVHRLEW
jgi:Iron-sulfur cluster-binding domain